MVYLTGVHTKSVRLQGGAMVVAGQMLAGRFQARAKMGTGGFADIFLGVDMLTGQEVAIKATNQKQGPGLGLKVWSLADTKRMESVNIPRDVIQMRFAAVLCARHSGKVKCSRRSMASLHPGWFTTLKESLAWTGIR